MEITLTPVRMDATLTLSRQGDVLTVNDQALDFRGVAEGETFVGTAFNCAWLASDVSRTGGIIRLTLILPLSGDAGPDARFPAPIMIARDGLVALPA